MKKYLIGFIIGAITCICITAYAMVNYQANQITYTKSNNEEITLDTALNELYTSADSVSDLQTSLNAWNNKSFKFGTPAYRSSQGIRVVSRNTSYSVSAGKYIVAVSKAHTASNANSGGVTTAYESAFELSCSGCTKTLISGYTSSSGGTTAITSESFIQMYSYTSLYYVDVSQSSTLSIAFTHASENSKFNSVIYMSVIPISYE